MELIDLLLSNADETTGCQGNQPWTIIFQDTLNPDGGGGDDFLDTLLAGSDSSSVPASPLWSPSPSDSGISEDPPSDHLDSPYPPSSPPFPFYTQSLPETPALVNSPSSKAALNDMTPDHVSIDLGWEPGDLQEQFGIAHYLTATPNSQLSSSHALTVKDLLLSNLGQKSSSQNSLKELELNDDEKKLLAKEGVNLPNKLPLSKFEERVLKKIRRKIRNKRSAQESRKKKREYVDSLEGRMTVCSEHNLELQRKVHQLEQTNNSLLEQLSRLQALLPNGSSKTTQTGTCILILLLSFSLFLSPSLQPDPYNQLNQEEYTEAKEPSRSLQSVVELEEVTPPAFSVSSGVEALSSLMEKLWSGTDIPDTDFPSNHNRDHSHRNTH